MKYNRKENLDAMHSTFNMECDSMNITNFKGGRLMKTIVQNCGTSDGLNHKQFILSNYQDIYNNLDLNILKKYDSTGGTDGQQLIDGLSPKVFSYIKEALIYYDFYIKKRNITEIKNLLIIGGGYGMEAVIIYNVLSTIGIKIHKITGIDMPNVAKLQNDFFKFCELETVCESFDENYTNLNIELVYSNCCLAELNEETNHYYFNNFINKSTGFYIIWGLIFADIPNYYKKYENISIDKFLNKAFNNLYAPENPRRRPRDEKRVNCLLVK